MRASRLSEVVSALGSQPSDPGSIPGPRLVDRECDDNALKALLREPPCRTCKKHPAGIKVQDYGCGSLDLIIRTKWGLPLVLVNNQEVTCASRGGSRVNLPSPGWIRVKVGNNCLSSACWFLKGMFRHLLHFFDGGFSNLDFSEKWRLYFLGSRSNYLDNCQKVEFRRLLS